MRSLVSQPVCDADYGVVQWRGAGARCDRCAHPAVRGIGLYDRGRGAGGGVLVSRWCSCGCGNSRRWTRRSILWRIGGLTSATRRCAKAPGRARGRFVSREATSNRARHVSLTLKTPLTRRWGSLLKYGCADLVSTAPRSSQGVTQFSFTLNTASPLSGLESFDTATLKASRFECEGMALRRLSPTALRAAVQASRIPIPKKEPRRGKPGMTTQLRVGGPRREAANAHPQQVGR